MSLKAIENKILLLTNLADMNCDDCFWIQHPPYAVCEQGISAVRKYFTDLKADEESRVPAVPVYILGNTMSGKTSLIRSLQRGRRYLTNRRSVSPLDETTKVFHVENLDLQNSKVKLIDHGGHEVYHVTYQLSLRNRCIPLIVVNMEEFEYWLQKRGPREATKLTCFSWLSHMYLSCPLLGSPVLVLTHKDKLLPDCFKLARAQLEHFVELLRSELLKKGSQCTNKIQNNLRDIVHLSNVEQPVFDEEEIFEFGGDPSITANIEQVNKCIDQRCTKFKIVLPQLWEQVGDYLDAQCSETYLTLSEIREKYVDVDVEVILKYMHNSGRIFWFENKQELSEYIFHRIPAITEMVSLLFHHSSKEKWDERLHAYTSQDKQDVGKQRYELLVEMFTENGILEEPLLVDILVRGSNVPFDVALQLLQSFHILHGPINQGRDKAFIIPSFASTFMDNSWETDGEIQLRSDINLCSLALPRYVFQLMTVAALSCDSEPYDVPVVRQNGVSIQHSGCSTYLIHDYNNQKVTLQVSTDVEMLAQSWKRLLNITKQVKKLVSDTWKACHSEIVIYCAHCLFLRNQRPAYDADPHWLDCIYRNDNTAEIKSLTNYDSKLVSCRRCSVDVKDLRPTVPKPFRMPCK